MYVKEIVLFLQAFRSSLKSKKGGDMQIEFAKNENVIRSVYDYGSRCSRNILMLMMSSF